MTEEKILNKYIELINKGYCCACNELNCIDNFPHKKIVNAISNLQQENKHLKSSIGSLEIALKERSEERDKYSFKEHLCKKVIEKANNELITLIQIIMEQPSKNVEEDNYLLSKLESISNILVGGNNER